MFNNIKLKNLAKAQSQAYFKVNTKFSHRKILRASLFLTSRGHFKVKLIYLEKSALHIRKLCVEKLPGLKIRSFVILNSIINVISRSTCPLMKI